MNTEWQEIRMGSSKLIAHVGAKIATWDEVEAVVTPEPTKSWTPIDHSQLVNQVAETLGYGGYKIKESAFTLQGNGARFFGLLGLDAEGGGGEYQVVVGLRNSHDKMFPVGMTAGARVFVCDNLSFTSEIQVTRRHTKNIFADLPRLITTACGKIGESAETQERRFSHYKEVELSDVQAHDLLVQSLDIGAIGSTALPKVLEQWRHPAHEEFAERKNIWRMWNSFTEVYKSYDLQALPRRSLALQGLFDIYTRFQPDKDEAEWEKRILERQAALAV